MGKKKAGEEVPSKRLIGKQAMEVPLKGKLKSTPEPILKNGGGKETVKDLSDERRVHFALAVKTANGCAATASAVAEPSQKQLKSTSKTDAKKTESRDSSCEKKAKKSKKEDPSQKKVDSSEAHAGKTDKTEEKKKKTVEIDEKDKTPHPEKQKDKTEKQKKPQSTENQMNAQDFKQKEDQKTTKEKKEKKEKGEKQKDRKKTAEDAKEKEASEKDERKERKKREEQTRQEDQPPRDAKRKKTEKTGGEEPKPKTAETAKSKEHESKTDSRKRGGDECCKAAEAADARKLAKVDAAACVQAQVRQLAAEANRAENGKALAPSPTQSQSGFKTPPPAKRASTESFSTVKTDATESNYREKKARAEAALKQRQDELIHAMKEAERVAEEDASGLEAFMKSIEEEAHPGDMSEALIMQACKSRDKAKGETDEASEETEDESSEEGSESADQEAPAPSEKGEETREKETENADSSTEEDGDEVESSSSEESEQADEAEEEQPEGEEAEESEASASEEDAGEASDQEADDDEQEEQDGSKGEEPAKEPQPAPTTTLVPVKKELVDATAATASAAQGTQRNSVSHKVEWDRFDRQLKSGDFPVSLAPMAKKRKDKVSLFNMWLDCSMDWDRTEFQVERFQSKENLARSQWVAVQAKDLKAKLGEEKFNQLYEKRKETGLTYPNEDFPDDPMETWVYMPQGKKVRSDQKTGESATLLSQTKCDQAMREALTTEGSILPNGLLPSVVCSSEAGQAKLLEMVEADGDKVTKAKKPRKTKEKEGEESENIVPKTPLEFGPFSLCHFLSTQACY